MVNALPVVPFDAPHATTLEMDSVAFGGRSADLAYAEDVVLSHDDGVATGLTIRGVDDATILEGTSRPYGPLSTTVRDLAVRGSASDDGLAGEGNMTLLRSLVTGHRNGSDGVWMSRFIVDACRVTLNRVGVDFEVTAGSSVTHSRIAFDSHADVAAVDWSAVDVRHDTVAGNAFAGNAAPQAAPTAGVGSTGDGGSGTGTAFRLGVTRRSR